MGTARPERLPQPSEGLRRPVGLRRAVLAGGRASPAGAGAGPALLQRGEGASGLAGQRLRERRLARSRRRARCGEGGGTAGLS